MNVPVPKDEVSLKYTLSNVHQVLQYHIIAFNLSVFLTSNKLR